MKKGDSIEGLLGWEWHGAPRMDLPGMQVVAEGDAMTHGKKWDVMLQRSTMDPKGMLCSMRQPYGGPMDSPVLQVTKTPHVTERHNRDLTSVFSRSPTTYFNECLARKNSNE